jgi:hypothetical protein
MFLPCAGLVSLSWHTHLTKSITCQGARRISSRRLGAGSRRHCMDARTTDSGRYRRARFRHSLYASLKLTLSLTSSPRGDAACRHTQPRQDRVQYPYSRVQIVHFDVTELGNWFARRHDCSCNHQLGEIMTSLAEQIRVYANRAFIEPARRAGRTEVTIVAGHMHKDMRLTNRMPAVCAALDAQKFQEEYGVVLSSRAGPRQGATAAWRYSLRR